MEIFFIIISILALILSVVIIIDRLLFINLFKDVENGMTGKEIQNIIGRKIIIYKITPRGYYAVAYSKLRFFKYQLAFVDGRLFTKYMG